MLESVRSLLPSTRDYRGVRRTWRGDVLAGVTVGIVALPLALAFGASSGAGAESGLVTAIVAGLVAAVFGGSHVQVSGPTGAMVIVIGPIIATHGVGALAVVTVIAGALVVLAGLLKIGRAVTYIPWPVIEGFTLGIALIIFLQQVPAALGTPPGSNGNTIIAAVQSASQAGGVTLVGSVVVVVVVAVFMVVTPRIHPRLPGSLIGIAIVGAAVTLTGLDLPTIGALPHALPAPRVPTTDWAVLPLLVVPALTVAALAAIESLLSARVAASISDTGPYDADRELVGQGLASVASGLFGGMPATGAIARTAVNVRSGGRSRIAAIMHSIVLIGVVYLAATVVSAVPLAALAGVLMVTAARMVATSTIRTVLGSTRPDAVVFVLTVLVTISFDLIFAVGIGMAAAGVFAVRAMAASSGVHREELPGRAVPGDERIALFRLDGALFFGVAERVLERVSAIDDVRVVILRMSQLQVLDATGARVITELIETLEHRGVTVLVKGLQDRHRGLITRLGVIEALRDHKHVIDDLDEAVTHARSHITGTDPSRVS